MKALSIKEPWVSHVVAGNKLIETRTWKTAYRGKLLLVGSKRPSGRFAGKAACIVNLVDCRRMRKADEKEAMCPVYPNAYAWILRSVELVNPVAVRGQLGIYEVADELIELTYPMYGDEAEDFLRKMMGRR